MNFVTTVIAFFIALGILIAFHEFGHYLAARMAGVKVLRFCLGFGRPIFMRRLGRDGTEWAVAAFPLGGYVKVMARRKLASGPAMMMKMRLPTGCALNERCTSPAGTTSSGSCPSNLT